MIGRVPSHSGPNLGDREIQVGTQAADLTSSAVVSTIRETEPWGVEDQPRFLNAVAELETVARAAALTTCSTSSASSAGERLGPRFGPRVIDLDLLLYGDLVVDEPGLVVPHPFLRERLFVLEPLAELDSGTENPRKRHGLRGPARRATIRVVSHLDELDEFEAEAELRLKKEYSAVFSLFRYCVLTQDATYLCNKLDLQYVPQPSYPFFHLKMEDVWVWDKNRPTRMIPRAEVYTSGDVTVEELNGEGDEPAVDRRGAGQADRRGSLRNRRSVASRGHAARDRRRQHPDRLRAVRRRAA